LLLAVGLLCCGPLAADSEPPVQAPPAPAPVQWVWSGDACGLHNLSICQLDDLFCRATVHAPMCGWHPGEVIVFTNMPAPKVAKKLADTFWVGKHIEPDGYFINQWKKRQALDSHIRIGPSFVDCKPCIIFEYPRCTPLFGPMRDEYREIAPGLYLGRMYRRVPCVKFLGYNYLQLSSPCCSSAAPPQAAPVPAAPAQPAAGAGNWTGPGERGVPPPRPN
jgi:hypothetical protein